MSVDDLSENQRKSIDVLDGMAGDKTRLARAERWVKNTLQNLPFYSQPNPPLLGLTAFIVAGGPSLKKNAAEMRAIGRLGVIVCVDASMRYLLSQGVVPDYCVSIDSEAKMIEFVRGVDTSRTTLVAMACSSPELIEYWKGPRWFYRAIGGSRDIDDKLIAANREVVATRDLKAGERINGVEDVKVKFPGLGVALMSGGNVTTSAHSFVHDVLRARNIVFVGADYSWVDDDEFYSGGDHRAMGHDRVKAEAAYPVLQLGGSQVITNFSMFSFKKWHEDVAGATGQEMVNATEGGILGVGKDGTALPGWTHMPLSEAVEKFTGQPVSAPCAA